MRMRSGIAGESGCSDIETFDESFDICENSVGWKGERRTDEWEIEDMTRYWEFVMLRAWYGQQLILGSRRLTALVFPPGRVRQKPFRSVKWMPIIAKLVPSTVWTRFCLAPLHRHHSDRAVKVPVSNIAGTFYTSAGNEITG